MLPVPKSLQGQEDDERLAVHPVTFTKLEVGPYRAEYGFKNGDAVVHFFRDGLYPASFRSRLWNAFQRWPGKVEIDWVEELNSWCVVIKGGGTTPPGTDEIKSILNDVVA